MIGINCELWYFLSQPPQLQLSILSLSLSQSLPSFEKLDCSWCNFAISMTRETPHNSHLGNVVEEDDEEEGTRNRRPSPSTRLLQMTESWYPRYLNRQETEEEEEEETWIRMFGLISWKPKKKRIWKGTKLYQITGSRNPKKQLKRKKQKKCKKRKKQLKKKKKKKQKKQYLEKKQKKQLKKRKKKKKNKQNKQLTKKLRKQKMKNKKQKKQRKQRKQLKKKKKVKKQ